jgi:hypothetical protein
MGEARRRKLAGTYPNLDDPFEAVRRFWCGRSTSEPVEDFRAPVGTIAITLDVHGAAPSTCMIDAAKLVDVMNKIEQFTAPLDYHQIVRFVGSELLRAKQAGDNKASEWIGLLCLWTALHHPKLGSEMRDAVSAALRRDGKAHISWQYSPATGLAMALAEKFVDLEGIAAAAPDDTVWGYTAPREDDGGAQH